MAFPARGGARIPLSEASRSAYDLAGNIRDAAASLHAQSLAGPVLRQEVHSYCDSLVGQDERLALIASQSGIGGYVQGEFDDPGLNVVAEFQAMRNAIAAVIANITGNAITAPGAGDELLEREFDVDGRIVRLAYTTAQMASLRALLTTLISTIDPVVSP